MQLQISLTVSLEIRKSRNKRKRQLHEHSNFRSSRKKKKQPLQRLKSWLRTTLSLTKDRQEATNLRKLMMYIRILPKPKLLLAKKEDKPKTKGSQNLIPTKQNPSSKSLKPSTTSWLPKRENTRRHSKPGNLRKPSTHT